MDTRPSWRIVLLLSVVVAGIIVASVADPVAQDPAYHRFADTRSFFGIPNFFDVVSNLLFAAVGTAGLLVVARGGFVLETKFAWLTFFAGVFLTAAGSGYYHFEPDNRTLAWDRLPMTIAIMSFVAIVIGEYLSMRAARRLLVPLLLVGAASVLHWAYTESIGHGDLRSYALVQFLPTADAHIF